MGASAGLGWDAAPPWSSPAKISRWSPRGSGRPPSTRRGASREPRSANGELRASWAQPAVF
eukprot:13431402-Alexandrium_andersonii.AAC.1